jgi:hypothetical protein
MIIRFIFSGVMFSFFRSLISSCLFSSVDVSIRMFWLFSLMRYTVLPNVWKFN